MRHKIKRDGFMAGPKLGEYLELNLKMVQPHCLGAAAGSALLLTGEWLLMMLGMGAVCAAIFSAYAKLFSETLYQKQACLFQSVPVSAFETALVKTLAGSIPPLLTMLVYVGGSLLFLDIRSERGMDLYLQLLEQGFTTENVLPGALLGLLAVMTGPFSSSGIFLFAVAVGNRARENRDKKPKRWAVLLVVGLLFAVQYGLAWLLQWMPFLSGLAEQAVSLVFNLLLAAGLLMVNTSVLERWYSA